MPIDFKASQIRTNKVIASGSDSKPYLLVYPSGSAADQIGGITRLSGTGSDSWLFISGGMDGNEKVVFGGESTVSGTFVVSPRTTDSLFYASVNSNPSLSRIGIKNNTPETTLHVGGTTDPGLLVDTGAVINYGRNNSSSATFLVQSKLGGDHGLLVVSGSCDRVSIGKHNPNAKLDVYGDGIYSGSLTVTGSLVARNITGSIQYVDTGLTTKFLIGDGISYYEPTGQWQVSGDSFVKSLQSPAWRGITTGSEQTEILVNGVERHSIPINTIQSYIILAAARQIGGSSGVVGSSRWFRIEGAAKNKNGVISLVGSSTTYDDGDAGTSTWDISLVPDNASSSLLIKVTGEANKQIDWSVVAYPANNIAKSMTLDGQFNWYGSTTGSNATEIFLDGIGKRFSVKENGNHTFSLMCNAFSVREQVYTRSDISGITSYPSLLEVRDGGTSIIDFSIFGVIIGDYVEFGNDGNVYKILGFSGALLDIGTSISPPTLNPINFYRGNNQSRWFKIDGGIKNVSGTTSIIGSTTTYDDGDSGASSWDVIASADDSNESLKIEVVGEDDLPISWKVSGYVSDPVLETINLQSDVIVWQGITTGSGYVEIFNGGMSKRFKVDDSKIYSYQIIGHGFQISGSSGNYGDSHWFRLNGAIKNVTGSVYSVGSNYTYDDYDAAASSWDLIVEPDVSSESIKAKVIGQDNKTIEWFVKGYITDITSAVGVGCSRPSGEGSYVQFNDGGVFGSDRKLTWNKYTSTLSATNITGSLTKLQDGSDYIRCGIGISIVSSSDGSITVSADGTSASAAGNLGNLQFNGGGYLAGLDQLDYDSTNSYLFLSGTAGISGSLKVGETASDNVEFVASLNSNIVPSLDSTYTLGTPTNRFAHIYTGDLHLRNERGNWTILEEREYLCVINNITGKKYKMSLIPMEDE